MLQQAIQEWRLFNAGLERDSRGQKADRHSSVSQSKWNSPKVDIHKNAK
jgi:hypothetical protein